MGNTISPLVMHLIQLTIYSFGFRLLSAQQAAITLWLAMIAMFKGTSLSCDALATTGDVAMGHFTFLAGKVSALLRPCLPFVLWSSEQPIEPCLTVCLWALLVFGFFLPVMLSNISEERSRRAFLRRLHIFSHEPQVWPMLLLHMVGMVMLFGAVVALALDTATILVLIRSEAS